MQYLIPSLPEIQARLFDPLPEVEPEATDGDVVIDQPSAATSIMDDSTPIPPRIAELHARRVAAREHFSDDHGPQSGQIRLCAGGNANDLPGSVCIHWPLAVLLWRPAAGDGNPGSSWQGWTMAQETDYATPMDVLLEAEDEPYDPQFAMVQLWNPVEVRIEPGQRVLGQLGPARLDVMARAADEQAAMPEAVAARLTAIPAQPGTLIERLVGDNQLVLCGTPLGGEDDPRHAYQRFYRQAATMVAAAAHQTAATSVATPEDSWWQSRWQGLVDRLKDFAADWTLGPLTPVLPAAPMRNRTAQTDSSARPPALAQGYEIDGLLRAESLPSDVPGALKLKVTQIGPEALQMRLLLHEDRLEQHDLNKPGDAAILFITPEPGLALEVQPASGPARRWKLEA